MLPKVVEVSAMPERRLNVRFSDGVAGIVEIDQRSLYGVFAPLSDPDFFAQAYVDHGAVTWPNGADLAPDAMHHALRGSGFWLVQ
ncbi:MAG: DUF2442 domain-containing protein [Alphaproteobacteria bacterium]|nr:DUF2442 domain-containing protein [Alphaproteobacteria bacterium]MCW5742558.1 DUF2442 domain-containing protein [Alphaproteobacteria bacterium]